MKAYIAETSCNQLLIDSARQLLTIASPTLHGCGACTERDHIETEPIKETMLLMVHIRTYVRYQMTQHKQPNSGTSGG